MKEMLSCTVARPLELQTNPTVFCETSYPITFKSYLLRQKKGCYIICVAKRSD